MSPSVVLPRSRLANKIIGQTTGGFKFQMFLARRLAQLKEGVEIGKLTKYVSEFLCVAMSAFFAGAGIGLLQGICAFRREIVSGLGAPLWVTVGFGAVVAVPLGTVLYYARLRGYGIYDISKVVLKTLALGMLAAFPLGFMSWLLTPFVAVFFTFRVRKREILVGNGS